MTGVDDDLVTDGDPVDARTDGVDGAGDVGAEEERILQLEVRQPLAHPEVDVIDRHCADAHAHLTRPHLRLGQLLDAKDLGTAVLSNRDRAHGAPK